MAAELRASGHARVDVSGCVAKAISSTNHAMPLAPMLGTLGAYKRAMSARTKPFLGCTLGQGTCEVFHDGTSGRD